MMPRLSILLLMMVMVMATLSTMVAADVAGDMLDAINKFRDKFFLPKLERKEELVRGAQEHSNRMRDANNASHFLRNEPGLFERYGLNGAAVVVSENISTEKTLQKAMDKWEISKGHFRNMVANVKYFGGGLAIGSDGKYYWTQAFSS
ncbi:CAP domain-containing protein [Syncephalis plumigaleata]|nr:CAP domain-containing protein [Syncephalis plumigaleata]